MTVRLKRSHLFGAGGLVVGVALGIGGSQWVSARAAERGPPAPPLTAPAIAPVDTTPRKIDVTGRSARGPAGAPVTIVEFTDYECPFCRQHFAQVLPALLKTYGDRVRYVVMNYPIPSLHPFATEAAAAVECAAAQGKFWEYHDLVFASADLGRPSLRKLAATARLNADLFGACLDSREVAALVEAHVNLGTSLGVTGTPTFFINGRLLEGAHPLPVLKQAIDRALDNAGK